MKYLKYISIFATTLILITFLIVKLYYHYDVPEYSGNKSLRALQDTVEIFKDFYGIPHIFAKNNEDLFFTAGYVIARERLFQMSLWVAVTRGEISKLLGNDYSEHDNYIQKNKLFSLNSDSLATINPENEALIQAYCSGINTWIDETQESLPLSFKILRSKPLKWTSPDVINIVSMMTGDLYQNRREEWLLTEIEQYFGEAKLLEMLDVNTFVFNNTDKGFSIDSINKRSLEIEDQIKELVGAPGQLLHGDVIILPSEQTVFAKPILIFEDRWGLQQPGKWYDIHLNGNNFNVEGSVIPGFPIPLIGKNDNTAWAFTGQMSVGAVNNLFDYIDKSETDESNVSISYADTSGFYSIQKENSRRFRLLQESLLDLDVISIDDVLAKVSKTKNERKSEIGQRIAKIYLDNTNSNTAPMNMLYGWNNNESESPETTLLNAIYAKLLENIFFDEFSLIGEDIFDIFISLPAITEQSINMILKDGSTSWVDDIKTLDYKENLIEIVVNSVDEALVELKTNFGNNIQNWRGVNTKIYKHILYNKSVIAKLFNLNIGPGTSYGPHNQMSGTSLRRIFDLSDMTISYSILPTGQSGLPKSIHYDDQVKLFNENNFRKIEFDEMTIRNNNQFQRLLLYPEK